VCPTEVPACWPGGLCVDWLRSCYESKWRLFKDSTHETPGYYYFAPEPDREHLEFPNHYGSRNWTTDDFPPDEVVLGEMPASTTNVRKWRNGSHGAVIPEPIAFGDPLCFEQGDSVGGAGEPSSIYDGISSRLTPYADQRFGPGLAAWMKPESLVYGTAPHYVRTWEDSSGLGRHLEALTDFPGTVVDTGGIWYPRRVGFNVSEFQRGLSWPGVIRTGEEMSVYLVGQTGQQEFYEDDGGIVLSAIPDTAMLVRPDYMQFQSGGGVAQVAFAPRVSRPFRAWGRVKRGAIEITWDGEETATGETSPPYPFCNGMYEVKPSYAYPQNSPFINEVIVFDRWLEDVYHAQVIDYLRQKYPIS